MNNKIFIMTIVIVSCIVLVPIIMVIVWDDESITNQEQENINMQNEKNTEQENVNIQNEKNTEQENVNIQDEKSTEQEESNIEEENTPYIPNNFSYLEGEKETGYTIEDTYGNQYVWVPVENKELTRNIQISECVEIQNTIEDFKNSVNKYKGFYIAKYESSAYNINDRNVSATMADKSPVSHVDYELAYEVANNSYREFGYSDVVTGLMNSYAWDTTLAWIDKTNPDYSISTDYGNYSETINNTGSTKTDIVNNICDLSGNLQEWTTEGYIKNDDDIGQQFFRIVRGGSPRFKCSSSKTCI